jgi:hypothetical protein
LNVANGLQINCKALAPNKKQLAAKQCDELLFRQVRVIRRGGRPVAAATALSRPRQNDKSG